MRSALKLWLAFLLLLLSLGCSAQMEKTVRVNDLQIAYQEFGRGYPLIMIMGFSGAMDMWDAKVLKELASHYRVIVFDNRGVGLSTAGTKHFSIPQFTDDTAALMEALKIKQAHVLGWSMGTNMAEDLAIRYPDRVNKLILYAADPGGKEQLLPEKAISAQMTDTSGTAKERGQRMIGLLFPQAWLKQNPDPRLYFPTVSEKTDPKNIAKQAQAMADWAGCYSQLSQIKSPTLLITGTDDVLTPPENSKIIAKRIPNTRVVMIPSAGHGLMFQYPERFSRIVLEFLEK